MAYEIIEDADYRTGEDTAYEILACNIRNNPSIKGFQLPYDNIPPTWAQKDTEIRISQVADDTAVLTRDKKSTFEIIETIELFSKVSGLRGYNWMHLAHRP